MPIMKSLTLGLGLLTAALATVGPAHASDYSFEGKTVSVVVPFSAGGSTDVFARLIATELGNRLPGSPTVKTVNMPGGGGVLGSNYVYGSGVTDGTMILVNSVKPWYQIIGDPAAQYDVSKVQMLATLSEPEVIYVSKDLGIADPSQFDKVGRPIRAAALSPNNTKSVLFNLLAELLQYETKVINGYPGGPEMRLAVQRGEADIGMETLSGFFGGIMQNPAFVPVMQSGVSTPEGTYVQDERLDEFDLKTMFEIVEAKRGPEIWNTVEGKALRMVADVYDVLRTISLPPGTDPAAVAAVRATMDEIMADPAFQEQAQKINGYRMTFRSGAESQKIVEGMIERLRQDPELLSYIQGVASAR